MTVRRVGLRSCLAGLAFWAAALLIASWSSPGAAVRAQAQGAGTDAQRAAGKQLYLKFCSQCHGENGDGEGYAAPHLLPRPRNFTSGK